VDADCPLPAIPQRTPRTSGSSREAVAIRGASQDFNPDQPKSVRRVPLVALLEAPAARLDAAHRQLHHPPHNRGFEPVEHAQRLRD